MTNSPSRLDHVEIAIVPEEYGGQETLVGWVYRITGTEHPNGGIPVVAQVMCDWGLVAFEVQFFDSRAAAELAEKPLGTACWPAP